MSDLKLNKRQTMLNLSHKICRVFCIPKIRIQRILFNHRKFCANNSAKWILADVPSIHPKIEIGKKFRIILEAEGPPARKLGLELVANMD